MDAIDLMRIKVRTAMNSEDEPLMVRVRAIARYFDQLQNLLKKPKANFVDVLTAYSAHLDQFLHIAQKRDEDPNIKIAVLALPVRRGIADLNTVVKSQTSPGAGETYLDIISSEFDMPVILDRVLSVAENKREHPKVRVEAIKAFEAVSIPNKVTFNPEMPADKFEERLTLLALQGKTSAVARFIVKQELI